MGEYTRQGHNENIDQEYNRDYVVKRQTEVRCMKQVNNIITATFESQKPMREYIRQEPHDENIDQEYNRDKQTEERSMKK